MKRAFTRVLAMIMATTTVLCCGIPVQAAAKKEVPITNVSFPATVTMKVGEKKTLSVTTTPSNTTYKTNIEWGSQTNGCFTVKTNGFGTYWNQKSTETLTATKAGTGYLNITVKVYDSTGKYMKKYQKHTTVKVTGKTTSSSNEYTITPETEPNKPVAPGTNTQPGTTNVIDLTSGLNGFEAVGECYTIINQYRKSAGVANLKRDLKLQQYAETRAKELVKLYSHTRPNGEKGYDIIPYSERTATGKAVAENIARGQTSCKNVMKAWYNSSGHRKNMLDKRFTKVGIAGYQYNGVIYWVQLFA